MSVACSASGTGTAGSCALQMPNALHQGSPRQLGLPQYSNWSVMSLFSLSNNLTFEKDLLPTSATEGKLLSNVF